MFHAHPFIIICKALTTRCSEGRLERFHETICTIGLAGQAKGHHSTDHCAADAARVTNTTTKKNVEELQKRNLNILVTATPRLEGRSFGTNVMEATLLALMDKPQPDVTETDFRDLIERIPLEPNIEVLN